MCWKQVFCKKYFQETNKNWFFGICTKMLWNFVKWINKPISGLNLVKLLHWAKNKLTLLANRCKVSQGLLEPFPLVVLRLSIYVWFRVNFYWRTWSTRRENTNSNRCWIHISIVNKHCPCWGRIKKTMWELMGKRKAVLVVSAYSLFNCT